MRGHLPSKPVSDAISFQPPKLFATRFICTGKGQLFSEVTKTFAYPISSGGRYSSSDEGRQHICKQTRRKPFQEICDLAVTKQDGTERDDDPEEDDVVRRIQGL